MQLTTTHPKLSLTQFEQWFESLKNLGKWGADDERGPYITSAQLLVDGGFIVNAE